MGVQLHTQRTAERRTTGVNVCSRVSRSQGVQSGIPLTRCTGNKLKDKSERLTSQQLVELISTPYALSRCIATNMLKPTMLVKLSLSTTSDDEV